MIPRQGQLTIYDLLNLKGKRQIIMTTALDFWTAKAAQAAGVDIVSHPRTTGGDIENVEDIVARVRVIREAAPNMLIMVSLLYMSRVSDEEAIRGAFNLLRAGASIIASGGRPERVAALTKQGIPCHSHVGLIPLRSTWIGGLRAVGKNSQEALKVYKDALAYQEAGAVMIEMECVPAKVAAEIAKRLKIPVISIGSGSGCDGQFLFSQDILGTHGNLPRHAKKYRDFFGEAVAAFKEFKGEAQSGAFPARDKLIDIKDEEFGLFRWYPIDDAQIRLYHPAGIAKYQLKNLQIPVDMNILFRDPNLVSTEIAVWEDNRPSMEAVNGGAIALGHPLGMSGARLLTTAMHQLQQTDSKMALCTMCIGVGQGIATVIKKV